MLGSGVTETNWIKLFFSLAVSHNSTTAYPPQFSKGNRMHVVSPRCHEMPRVMLHMGTDLAYRMSRQRCLTIPAAQT